MHVYTFIYINHQKSLAISFQMDFSWFLLHTRIKYSSLPFPQLELKMLINRFKSIPLLLHLVPFRVFKGEELDDLELQNRIGKVYIILMLIEDCIDFYYFLESQKKVTGRVLHLYIVTLKKINLLMAVETKDTETPRLLLSSRS